jgi:hypothetical protein
MGTCERAHSRLSVVSSVGSLRVLPAMSVLTMGTSSSPGMVPVVTVDDEPLAGAGGADNDRARIVSRAVGGVEAALEP